MHILFISYAEISLNKGDVRSTAMLLALSEAGYRVDVLAPAVDLPPHAKIRLLTRPRRNGMHISRIHLQMAAIRALTRTPYQAIHAMDEAAFFALRLCQWKKIPLVYDAKRCFSRWGTGASQTETLFRQIFPRPFRKLEQNLLDRAQAIISSSTRLTQELKAFQTSAPVIQIEDIPVQSILSCSEQGEAQPLWSNKTLGTRIVFSVASPPEVGLREIVLSARKVLDAEPESHFLFLGVDTVQTRKIATRLGMESQCIFLPTNDASTLSLALSQADGVCFIPRKGARYIHPQIYTLLHSGVPLLLLQNKTYSPLLDAGMATGLLADSEEMAQALLSVLREPLFFRPLALAGQQLMAKQHTCSSFKHQVRMVYRGINKGV
jgi:glycosyltransferase involved in cell wall biosynthesis